MQGHVLPVATEVRGHLDAVEERHHAVVFPPVIADRVLDGDLAPQVVPRMRVVVQLEQDPQADHGGVALRRGELAMNVRGTQQVADAVDEMAAPELVGFTGGHADHGQERRDERRAHQAVVHGRLV